MRKFTFDNPKQLELNSISERLKIAFKDIPFGYSHTPFISLEDENPVISSQGSKIIAIISESQPEINEIEEFLSKLLEPNYNRLLLEFANKFLNVDGASIVETPPSSVSIYINNKPAAGLRLWLNSEKQPHEIEIIPFQTDEGIILSEWVLKNQRDILNANIYVAGDLVRMVTIIK